MHIHICMTCFCHALGWCLKTSNFKSDALSATQTLLDRSLGALQFPTHPFKLIPNWQ